MDEKDLKTPQSGDTCPIPDNSTQGQLLSDQNDRKLIENHEKLLIENHEKRLIEDKGAFAAAELPPQPRLSPMSSLSVRRRRDGSDGGPALWSPPP